MKPLSPDMPRPAPGLNPPKAPIFFVSKISRGEAAQVTAFSDLDTGAKKIAREISGLVRGVFSGFDTEWR
jgi:hypothetical protein